MALVQRYVNTASSAGGDGTTNATTGANRAYASLNEWEAAEDGVNLITDGDTHKVDCTGTLTSQDTTALIIDGWTTGPSNDITIDGLDPFDGYFLDTVAASQNSVRNYEDYVTVQRLRVQNNYVGSFRYTLRFIDASIGAAKIRLLSNRVTALSIGVVTGAIGIAVRAGIDVDIINNVVTCPTGIFNIGVDITGAGTTGAYNLYNNTCVGADTGYRGADVTKFATARCINNIGQDAVNGAFTTAAAWTTFTNNLSDDTTGNSGLQNVTLTFADADKHLDSTDTEAMGVGANLYSDSYYAVTTDIDGDARPDAAFDLGADHYIAVGGATIPVFMNHYRNQGIS